MIYRYKNTVLLSIIILFSYGLNKKKLKYQYEKPPGTIQIDSNFFIDRAEVRNFDWLEYEFWTKQVFGDSSDEYRACLPNVDLWLYEDSCIAESYYDYYLRHPAYRDFPVVGITQQQARDYCKWRSDRVFHYILVKAKILEYETDTKEDYFTVEKYLNGEYKGFIPDSRIVYYPLYSLPTEKEWKKAKVFFDDHNRKVWEKCHSKKCKLHYQQDSFALVYNVTPCVNDTFFESPTKNVLERRHLDYGFHFYGNVSEWIDADSKFIGGNWKDSTLVGYEVPRDISMVNYNIRLQREESATTIGFRCVCEWKKW